MENNDPSRRQIQPNAYVGQPGTGQATGQYNASSGSVERFRQSSFLQQSPTSAPSSARAANDGQQMYQYAQSAQYGTTSMQTNSMQYAPEIASETPRQQQQQQYAQFGSNVMYGVPQQPQAPTASPYEQIQQYRPRQSATAETLSTQFGVPQTSQYYIAQPSGPTSAPPSDLPALQLPSQYQQVAYPQPGPSAPQAYSGMSDPAQSGAYGAYGQQQQQQQYAAPTSNVDHSFVNYQSQVRTINTYAREGNLLNVSDLLLAISHYLLGNSEQLGLTRDDDTMHDDRIRLWDEFNRCWLVVLQKQRDMMQGMSTTGLSDQQSLLSQQQLDSLSRELVRLDDSVEKHGLVDYQMGVAEEEIMDLLLDCLSLYDPPSERPVDSATQVESSSSAAARQR